MKTTFSCLALIALAACGILNLGGTTETGEPKTELDARVFLRSLGDAALRTWGSSWLREHQPGLLSTFDSDQDGVLSLAEAEAHIDLTNPNSTTGLLVLAIELFRAQRAQR